MISTVLTDCCAGWIHDVNLSAVLRATRTADIRDQASADAVPRQPGAMAETAVPDAARAAATREHLA